MTSNVAMGLKALSAVFAAFVGFTTLYNMTYRKALRTGENSWAMALAGRKGCLLMTKVLAKVAKGNPEVVRARMRLEALEAIEKAKKDKDAHSQGAIYFVGSSTFTFWTHLKRDMCPLRCVNLAFGGSLTSDLIEHIPAYVAFKPELFVYYCGANDLSYGCGEQAAAQGFIDFATEVRKHLPHVGIIYLSISLTPLQHYLGNAESVKKANQMVFDYIGTQENMSYVDITQDENFTHNLSWYLNDGLHLNNLGHQKLADALRPAIEDMLKRLGDNVSSLSVEN